MVNSTMKSIFAARVSSSQQSPNHKSRMQANRIQLLVVIALYSFRSLITCKDNDYFLKKHYLEKFSFL